MSHPAKTGYPYCGMYCLSFNLYKRRWGQGGETLNTGGTGREGRNERDRKEEDSREKTQ